MADKLFRTKGRRPKAYSQAERLTRMLRALSSREVTVTELAQEFKISRCQVYRELSRIEEEGHPLEQSDGDGEKTWRLSCGPDAVVPDPYGSRPVAWEDVILPPGLLQLLRQGRLQIAQ